MEKLICFKCRKNLDKSIHVMLNEISKTRNIPLEWQTMKIKSIYKNKGSRKQMKNQRGLFITNILSKLMEKILYNRNVQVLRNGISEYQCGSMKNRGTADHLFTLQAIIDYNRYIGGNFFIIFADAEKCFDKLWLNDACNELFKIGVPPEEIELIQNMNTNANIYIDTAVGMTEKIQIKEVVRQGTIMGPILCTVETDKINAIGETSITNIGPELPIKNLIYVDDIAGIGTKDSIETVGRNLMVMEERKKFTFNNEKTEIMSIRMNNRNRNEKTPIVRVKKGEVGFADSVKYLGEWIFPSQLNASRIKKREEKLQIMITKIQKYGSKHKVGDAAIKVKLKILEAVVMPALTYNMEIWTNLKDTEIKKMQKIQKMLLCSILQLESSTPYWGLLKETGTLPIMQTIHYKKLMLLHHLLNSDETRIARKIILLQKDKEYPNCWYSEIKELSENYKLDISTPRIMKMTKSAWKKEIKTQIKTEVERMDTFKCTGTKMRFLASHNYEKQDYLEKLPHDLAILIIKLRLNMIKAKANFKNSYSNIQCDMCEEEETTEHILICPKLQKLITYNPGKVNLCDTSNLEQLKRIANYIKQVENIKSQLH